jgi:hypothetical protein
MALRAKHGAGFTGFGTQLFSLIVLDTMYKSCVADFIEEPSFLAKSELWSADKHPSQCAKWQSRRTGPVHRIPTTAAHRALTRAAAR